MDYKIQLQSISRSTQITSTNNDSIGFLLKRLIHNSPKTHFLHIAKNDREATILQKQIEFFASHNVSEGELEILNFPSWDCLPYDRVSPKINVVASRINCLHKLIKNAPPSSANKKTLVISTIKAALQKTVPAELIKNLGFKIEVGDEVSIDLLARSLIDNGFSRTGIASGISEFAIRGNIVDIITASNQIADDLIGYRLDFFGDTIEAIRVFDPATQLTLNKVNQVSLLPMAEINLNEKAINNFKKNYRTIFGSPSEDMLYNSASEGRHCDGIEHFMPLFYEQPLSSIFEYLENPQISFSSSLAEAKNEHLKTINEYYMARVDGLRESKKSGAIYNPIEPSSLYLNDAKFEKELEKNVVIIFSESKPSQKDRQIDLNFKPIPDFALASRANKTNVFDLFKNFLEAELGNNTLDKSRETAIPLNRGFHKIVLFCSSEGSKERLRKILVEHQINNKSITKAQEISKLSKNQIGLGILPIGNGFYCSDLMVIGESALLGEKVRRSNSRQSFEKMIAEGLTLQVGELIVHRYHGIGKFDGLHNIETGTSSTSNSSRSDDFLLKKLNTKPKTIKNDFLKILYFGSDVLFVPVEDINLISRYGSDNSLIILDKLGKNNWENRREKVRKKIKIAAETLIKIAAERQIRKAPILIPGQMEYEEFKATFGFEETEDQIRAISEVEEDLQKGSPMDRLVCGDVGFGKTEVAIRAAFIVAANEYVNKEIINISNPTQPKEIEIENKGSNLKKEESSNTQNSIHSEETGDPRNAGRNECSVLQEKECVST
ncbi:MAG: transcription-repair coupling factor (superfamily II helicase), partial [Rickettsiales bacterium]